MIQHYIKFFVRNMFRQKGFTIINILGLSVGMAVSILILLYVYHEISYDRFIGNHRNKYLVYSKFTFAGETHNIDRSCGELAPRSMSEVPEIKSAVSLYDAFPHLRYKEKLFRGNDWKLFFSTPGVFDFFSIQLLEGNKDNVFIDPFSIVMSETMAKTFFGDEDPIGKIIRYDDEFDFKVTGIIKDYPDNSHINISGLMPMQALMDMEGIPDMTMLGNSCFTYVELNEHADHTAIIDKLVKASYSFVPPALLEQLEVKLDHYLQSISSIHLYGAISDFDQTETLRRIVYIYIFGAVAIFILLLACINFMNLSTARYANRAREVGMRKVLGAERSVIFKQFLGESMFYSIISLITAIVLTELFLPAFNDLLGTKLTFINAKNLNFIWILIGLGLLVGIIAGSYPAFFLSSFRPLSVLQGNFKTGSSGKYFRWGLVVFQFIVAIALISGTIVIYLQMDYVRNKDLGFERENLLIVHLSSPEITKSLSVFKDELQSIPGIKDLTFSTDKPGVGTSWYGVYKFDENDSKEHPAFAMIDIDEDFVKTIGLEIAEGRNFDPALKTDTGALIINQAMQKYLGWNQPLGKSVYEMTEEFGRRKYTVIGVLKDFHMESLHKNIQPMLFKMKERNRYCIARIHPEAKEETITAVRAVWDELSPSHPFNYHFLNESYDAEYKSERQFARIFLYFTLFAIFIACLGIIGLVSFLTLSRTNEIGIRKVLGSSSSSIVRLITSDFLKMLLVSFIVACPLAWFFMDKWLERFAYKIDLNIWIFITAGLITLIITLLSVAYHSLAASNKNPVDALRYE